jgi:carnitine O-acetyltransferase
MSPPPAIVSDTSTSSLSVAVVSNPTFGHQSKLPKLPIPPLEDTCARYLQALVSLQDEDEHECTKLAVKKFLEGDGPKLQEQLKEWASDKDSYIEEFW